jgi:hypothetical protein
LDEVLNQVLIVGNEVKATSRFKVLKQHESAECDGAVVGSSKSSILQAIPNA